MDVHVNSVGIVVEHVGDRPVRQAWKETLGTNVFGIAAAMDALISLLKKSIDPGPRIVFISRDLRRLEMKYNPNRQ